MFLFEVIRMWGVLHTLFRVNLNWIYASLETYTVPKRIKLYPIQYMWIVEESYVYNCVFIRRKYEI